MPEWVWLASFPVLAAGLIVCHAIQRWQRSRPAKHGDKIQMRRCGACGLMVRTGLPMQRHFDEKHSDPHHERDTKAVAEWLDERDRYEAIADLERREG